MTITRPSWISDIEAPLFNIERYDYLLALALTRMGGLSGVLFESECSST